MFTCLLRRYVASTVLVNVLLSDDSGRQMCRGKKCSFSGVSNGRVWRKGVGSVKLVGAISANRYADIRFSVPSVT